MACSTRPEVLQQRLKRGERRRKSATATDASLLLVDRLACFSLPSLERRGEALLHSTLLSRSLCASVSVEHTLVVLMGAVATAEKREEGVPLVCPVVAQN
jgi:hypothetical protein